jgi:23S rRNA (pseudouridine1915-N3)-methyltransferase
MKLHVLAVGRVRDVHLRALCDEFDGRLRRFLPGDVLEVRDARTRDPARARQEEGERLLGKLPPGCLAVALDEGGRERTSVGLAEWLQARQDEGLGELRFVIGGAWGLSDDVKARCRGKLRLSAMTLTHEMARLVLLEQLYRAASIQRGLPYHHA